MAALLGLGSPLLACQREDKSGVEELGDRAMDALGMREHEKMKDAGAALKEEAESLKEKAE